MVSETREKFTKSKLTVLLIHTWVLSSEDVEDKGVHT